MNHSEILRDHSFIHLTQIRPPRSKEIVVGRCPLKSLNQSQTDTGHAEAATRCHHHSLALAFTKQSHHSRLDKARIEEEAENGDKKEHLYMLQVVVDIISVSAALLALIALLVYIIKRYLSSEWMEVCFYLYSLFYFKYVCYLCVICYLLLFPHCRVIQIVCML